jgi:hypothetical protein
MNSSSPEADWPAHKPTAPAAGAAANLERQYENLHVLFEFALVALILLGLSVTLFMFKQMRLVRAQLAEQRPIVNKLISDYQKHSEPLVRNFTGAMQRFASSNADFQPIVEKYRPVLKDYLTTAPLPATPAPSGSPTQSQKP